MLKYKITKTMKSTILFCLITIVGFSQCTDPASNCNNFDIPITNNTSAINYGVPVYNGTALTDYIINWVDSDGNIAFTSAGGSFYDPAIHEAHPPITDIPLSSGFYEPVLVSSNPSAIVSCKSAVEIVPYECTGEPQTVSYEGTAGGVTRIFEINVPADCDINIDFFDDILVDNYEIFGVNGGVQTLIGSGGDGNQLFTVPSGYTSVIVQVTSADGDNTIWDFTFECCYVDPCEDCDNFELTYDVLNTDDPCRCISFIKPQSNIQGCDLNVTTRALTYSESCGRDVTLEEGCYSTQASNTVTYVSDGSALTPATVVFGFASTTDFNYIQQSLNGLTADGFAVIQTKNQDCDNDGAKNTWYIVGSNTVSYDAVLQTITVTYDGFLTGGDGCDESACNIYAGEYNQTILTASNTTYDVLSFPFISVGTNVIETILTVNNQTSVQEGDNFFTQDYSDTAICGDDGLLNMNTIIRDIDCPCESYQVLIDADDNGTYETVIDEAQGWTGECPCPDADGDTVCDIDDQCPDDDDTVDADNNNVPDCLEVGNCTLPILTSSEFFDPDGNIVSVTYSIDETSITANVDGALCDCGGGTKNIIVQSSIGAVFLSDSDANITWSGCDVINWTPSDYGIDVCTITAILFYCN